MIRLTGQDAFHAAQPFRRICERKGWLWRDPDHAHWAVQVFGIRSANSKAGKFDDEAIVIYSRPDDGWVVDRYCITTDPGPRFLKKPIHPRGAAILAHDHQYTYKPGIHRVGKAPGYQAVVQADKVLVYRDDDHDDIIEFYVGSIMVGLYGIHHHHGGKNYPPGSLFAGISAGCQVWCSKTEFEEEYIPVIHKSRDLHGPEFPYVVLLQADVDAEIMAYAAEREHDRLKSWVWPFFD